MFLKILLNYIFGYVSIKIESFYLERFLNICISKKIFLWNTKREKSSILYANIGIADFKRIKEIARKTKSIVKIERKRGLPFILFRYKKRKTFFGFLFLTMIILIVSSNYIWNIDVIGNESISNEEILEELKDDGLNIGMLKNRIDINSVINKIRLEREDIAWIGISLKGTNAIVEIKETKKAPNVLNENEYCNIISDKEALITKINVQNGTANVKEGDIVKAGDIMVLGYLEGKYTGKRYVHAQANIEAKVWYSKKEKFYYNQSIKTVTTATEEKYALKIKNFKINFYKTLSKFQNYDTICKSKKIMLFSNFYLPIEIIKITNYEFENKDIVYTEEQLAEIGKTNIENELEKQIEKKENIINKQVNTYANTDYIEVEVIYEVLENIGIEDRILFEGDE